MPQAEKRSIAHLQGNKLCSRERLSTCRTRYLERSTRSHHSMSQDDDTAREEILINRLAQFYAGIGTLTNWYFHYSLCRKESWLVYRWKVRLSSLGPSQWGVCGLGPVSVGSTSDEQTQTFRFPITVGRERQVCICGCKYCLTGPNKQPSSGQ